MDRGGTFTDLIGCDPQGGLHIRKLLSESTDGGDPAVTAMADLVGCASGCPIPPGVISSVRLGTTVATNPGLADQPLIGDQHRSELFAFQLQSPSFRKDQVIGGGMTAPKTLFYSAQEKGLR